MPTVRIKTKIKMKTKGLKELGKKLQRQKDMIVDVGHFGGKLHDIDSDETIAGISLINQQGSGKIPPRPYMLHALRSPAFVKRYNLAVLKIAKGKSTIAVELPKLGRLLRDVMKGSIQTSRSWAIPNAPTTEELKGRNHPLLHTGDLVNDISFMLVRDISRRRTKGLNKVAV